MIRASMSVCHHGETGISGKGKKAKKDGRRSLLPLLFLFSFLFFSSFFVSFYLFFLSPLVSNYFLCFLFTLFI